MNFGETDSGMDQLIGSLELDWEIVEFCIPRGFPKIEK
jgi:hypothetical protein